MSLPQTPQCSNDCRNQLDVMKQLVNDGMPVVHVFPQKLACFSYLLFEIEDIFVDESMTAKERQLRIKMLGNGTIIPVMTNENCGMERWEEIHTFNYTTVASNVVNSNTVNLTDINMLRGITTNTQIRFITGAAPFTPTSPGEKRAIVTNVTGNTVTLNANVTVNAGDRVFRGGNLRVHCAAIDNTYNLNQQCKYISYFQNLQAHLDFETCELSLDRDIYNRGAGPQYFVNAKMNAVFENLLKVDFIDMFLYGANVPQNKAINQAAQTRGIVWSIQDAQICNNKPYIVDLENLVGGSCSDPQGNCSDELVISTLIDYFTRAFSSGYYNNEPITAVINNKQLEHLMNMAPAFYEFFNIQMYKEVQSSHAGCQDYVSLRVHAIDIEFGSIEFVLFEPLTHYFPDTSIMMLMPRSMYGFYQREVQKMDSNMQVSKMGNQYPTFKFYDVSDYLNAESGGDECYKYLTKMEIALAQAGVYNDAYYILKNANSYRTRLGAPVQSEMVQIAV